MAKCVRCGGSFLLRGKVNLADADICGKCFKELGFDKDDLLTASIYKYDSIKDGRDAYYMNCIKKSIVDEALASASVKIVGGNNNHELVCTEEEREIYNIICSLANDDRIQLFRKSDNYVSAVITSSQGYGEMDIARFKFTTRAKWIRFGPDFEKVPLTDPDDVEDMADEIQAAYEAVREYL